MQAFRSCIKIVYFKKISKALANITQIPEATEQFLIAGPGLQMLSQCMTYFLIYMVKNQNFDLKYLY